MRSVILVVFVATTSACGQATGAWTGTISGQASGGGVSVTAFPSSTTVEQTAVVPLQCTDGVSNTGTWTLASGVGSITSDGNYTAPGSNGSATARCTIGSNHADVPITVSGTIPTATGNCATGYANRNSTPNDCGMTHTETSGTDTRRWFVIVPTNYVSGTSALIVNFGGGGHGLGATGEPCGVPGGETTGWMPYVDDLASPAPVLVCPQGVFNPAGSTEKWKFIGITTGGASWLGSVVPDDLDFVRQLILMTVRDLNLNPRKVFVTTDWPSGSFISPFGKQFAAANADLVAALGTYNDSDFFGMDYNATTGTYTVATTAQAFQGSTMPPPIQPISVVMEPGITTAAHGGVQDMCGTNLDTTNGTLYHPDTIDTDIAYWKFRNGTTTASYSPSNVGTSFCSGTFDASNNGLPSSLQAHSETGGVLGTDVVAYRFKSQAQPAMWCSFDPSGNDTLGCNNATTGSRKALDLSLTTPCDFTSPCNNFVDVSTGIDPIGIIYKFFVGHAKL